MTTIKLNNYYPHLTECVTLEVSEEIAVTLSIGGRMCDSYKRRKRDHAECSLDGIPGFEADVTYPPLTPEEIMELAEDRSALYAAKERRRGNTMHTPPPPDSYSVNTFPSSTKQPSSTLTFATSPGPYSS